MRQSLQTIVSDEIKKMIEEQFSPGDQLPSEAKLAQNLSVSRNTVREVLKELEIQGLIIRKHGVGSFISGQPLEIHQGLEKNENLTDSIRRKGLKAEERILSIEEVDIGDERIIADLKAMAGEKFYSIKSLRYANGIPVNYCNEIVRKAIIGETQIQRRAEFESLLSQFCDMGVDSGYYYSTVEAALPPEEVGMLLDISSTTPLIKLSGPTFTLIHEPMYYSINYFRSDVYKFTLIRR